MTASTSDLPFDVYLDDDSFVYVYLDPCVAEFILRGVQKICMLLVISYVHIGKKPTPLNYAHAMLMLSTRVEYLRLPTYLDSFLFVY